MDKIPAAKKIVNKWAMDNGDLLHDAAIEAMVEFAKLHVEAALAKAAKKAKINEPDATTNYLKNYVDKDSILNAYRKSKIK